MTVLATILCCVWFGLRIGEGTAWMLGTGPVWAAVLAVAGAIFGLAIWATIARVFTASARFRCGHG